MTKKTTAALVFVLLTGIGGLLLLLNNLGIIVLHVDGGDTSPTKFNTVVLERRDLKTYKVLDGTLVYDNSVQISPSGNGILTYIAPVGSTLNRGSVVFRFYTPIDDTELLSAELQIASADASVAQAKLALENLNAPATPAQIASADASVAQAKLALENLNAPATPAQIASADASVAQAKLALENLNAPATPAQIASADAAIAQAENNLLTAVIPPAVETEWRKNQLTQAFESLKAVQEQRTALDNPPTAAEFEQANLALEAAREQRSELDNLPTTSELEQANLALKAAREQRSELDNLPTTSELEQANLTLKAAREQRSELDNLPTTSELEQANLALKAAQEQRTALDNLPTISELELAKASLKSAEASWATASANLNNFIQDNVASILMFGSFPAWRDFETGMKPGEDVKQLKQNLFALGYSSHESMLMDQNFDASTAEAIKKMQLDLDIPRTGRVNLGDIVFLPGTSMMESSQSYATVGTAVNPDMALVTLTPMERTQTQIERNGDISITTEILQRVNTFIEVADQNLVDIGSKVRIELPNEALVGGTIRKIESIAVIPGGTADPYFEMSVAVDGHTNLHKWTGAPVTVSITKELASNVLAAPVTSLLALLDGGYALEVLEQESTRLVPVEVEIYADGWVEVNGSGLEAGTEIVVAK